MSRQRANIPFKSRKDRNDFQSQMKRESWHFHCDPFIANLHDLRVICKMGTNTGLGTHPSIGPISPLILPASKCKSPCDLDSFQEGETFYFILATVNSTKEQAILTWFSVNSLWVLKMPMFKRKKKFSLWKAMCWSLSAEADAVRSPYSHTQDVSAEYSSTCHTTSSRTKTKYAIFT